MNRAGLEEGSAAEAIPSPCTQVCRIDPRLAWCVGCGRTIAEIGEWPDAGAGRRSEILRALPRRMTALAANALTPL